MLRFRAPSGGRGAAGYLREYAVATLRLARLVRRIRRASTVDLVLVCGPPDSLVALALPLARRGAGIVFDLREISPELFEAKFGRRGPLHRLLLASERFALQRADAVITVSEPCAQIARTRGGVAPDRIFHVGNGPDPQRIFDVPARAELRRGHEHLVLWLGCMSSQEGLSRLIEAADHVVNDLGRKDVQFALVGPGDVHDELRELVRLRGLEDAVLIEGQVDDDCVRAYMATADVCVNVDERNAMNDRAAMRKVMEYMAMGRPVVQFPLAEMRRLCGDATVYARNADARDLAEQIVKLLDDPERRERLGNLARARAQEGLMWPRQVPALLAAVAVAVAGCGTSTDAPGGAPTHGSGGAGEPLLFDAFAKANGPNGLITNEYALSNADGVRSPRWEMTSGSLFVRDGSGWSGVPDTTAPDRLSRRTTDSAVFRLRTKAASFGDVIVRAEVRVNRWLRARRRRAAGDRPVGALRLRAPAVLAVGAAGRRQGRRREEGAGRAVPRERRDLLHPAAVHAARLAGAARPLVSRRGERAHGERRLGHDLHLPRRPPDAHRGRSRPGPGGAVRARWQTRQEPDVGACESRAPGHSCR